MTNLSIFAFEGQQVRFVGTADCPEWVAADVCSVLGIKNARDTLTDFEPDEKGVATVYTLGGSQETLTVTEPGLYRLIFKSRKEVAKRFQRWIFHEVIPSIRKTGSYSISTATPSPSLPLVRERLESIQLAATRALKCCSKIIFVMLCYKKNYSLPYLVGLNGLYRIVPWYWAIVPPRPSCEKSARKQPNFIKSDMVKSLCKGSSSSVEQPGW